MRPLRIFGVPVFGVILPFVGRRRIPLNRDGSFVDDDSELIEDGAGWYYVEPFAIEWLGFGLPLGTSPVRLVATGEIVDDPPFEIAG